MSNKVDLDKRNKCRICHSKNLLPFANLGCTPLADKFITVAEIEEEKSYPLEVVVCEECRLVQLNHDVDDDELFGSDYAFFTSASPSSIKYFEDYAKDMMTRYPNQSKGFVVEIASNDGTLLQHFKKKGARVLGIDPALPAAKMAEDNGIPTITKFFNRELADEPLIRNADLVLANNVIAHVTDLNDVFEGISEILSEDGVFVFEAQYFFNLLFNSEWDHVYHEHRSFFSLTPLNILAIRNNLRIIDVVMTEGQGGSIRVSVVKKESLRASTSNVRALLSDEERFGVNDNNLYSGFQYKTNFIKSQLPLILKTIKSIGKTVYGYGASAKSCTLLNYCGIGPDLLPCIVDKTPYKIGKLAPGTHIPVVSDVPKEPDYYLLLVWNYLPGVLKREEKFTKDGGHFILPIPVIKVL